MKYFDYVLLGIVAILAVIGIFAPSVSNTNTVDEASIVGRVIDVLEERNLAGLVQVGEKIFTDGWAMESKPGTETMTADIDGDLHLTGDLNYRLPRVDGSATTTLTTAQSGSMVAVHASGTTTTLPSASTAGQIIRIVVTALFDTANHVVDSAEGDNIYGTLNVNGGAVVCDAEDQINFVNTAEALGDYVELVSYNSNWFINGSVASSTGAITCTDPS